MYVVVMSAPTAPDDLAFSALPDAPVVPEGRLQDRVRTVRRLRSGLAGALHRFAAAVEPVQRTALPVVVRSGGRPAPRTRTS